MAETVRSSILTRMIEPSFTTRVPDGDEMSRKVCDHCGFVAYENPKIVVGSVVRHEGRILLCRRAIAPRAGFWTIPAGYLELNETPEAGAAREAREEAGARIELGGLLGLYSVPRISQVQLIFRARLADPAIAAGIESLEVRLVAPDEIPWDDLAFPSVHWALRHDIAAEGGAAIPFTNPPNEAGDRMPDGRPVAPDQM